MRETIKEKKMRMSIVHKSLGGVIATLILFSLIIGFLAFHTFTNFFMGQYAEGALYTAETAVMMIDPDRMDEYVEKGEDAEDYQQVWENLDHLCNTQGATYVYVIRPDVTDYNHIFFVFSTMKHGLPFPFYPHGYLRETTNDDYRKKYRAIYEGLSDNELVIRDKGFIETEAHITIMVPIRDSRGETKGILCVQRQMEEMVKERKSFLIGVLLFMLLTMVVLVITEGGYLNRILLEPILLITNEASRFATEHIQKEEKLTDVIRSRDEVGRLAGSIDEMETQIRNYVRNLTEVTAEKERISTELSLAARIQSDMLPSVFPPFPDRKEFDLFAEMVPAREVGGDFYDFFLIDEDHLCMVMADVSGKGVPAALFMMASKTILKNCAYMGLSPAQILKNANDAICANNLEQMFVTVWLGILEISTGKLLAANAGHEFPVICPPDGEFELYRDKHGFVLGGMEGMSYREYELKLEPGSRLFLYTDGLPEATREDNTLFGNDRMLAVLNTARGCPPQDVLRSIWTAVDEFVGDAEQFDDLTMLCMVYNGSEQVELPRGNDTDMKELTYEANLENIPALTAFVESQLEDAGCSRKVRTQLAIAIDELFSNISRYAFSGQGKEKARSAAEGQGPPAWGSAIVRFEILKNPRAVQLTFIDRGIPYDPLKKRDPDVSLSLNERMIGGLGIFMVKKTMDAIEYEHVDGKNILKIRKNF